ncbi:MAG: AAA family ATPase, partial [Ilumatobacteraceae bacterium]
MTDTTIPPLLPAGTADLGPFVAAGVLDEAAIQVAGAIGRAVPATSPSVLLAAALCVRGLTQGHVCIVLADAAATTDAEDRARMRDDLDIDPILDLPWPDPASWAGELAASDAVTVHDADHPQGHASTADPAVLRPLVFDGDRVYLERYWRYERQVGDLLLAQAETPDEPGSAAEAVDQVLDHLFDIEDGDEHDLQRAGARSAIDRRLTVLAGGPGTGKTHTIARALAAILQLVPDDGRPPEIALAAPTGKAAARMSEAIHQAVGDADLPEPIADRLRSMEAQTIHRLLGWAPGVAFRHDSTNPVPHDLVVVDETSMVALPLMARLLDALRPEARLVLVGDPYQLASVEAGAVLGDVVGPVRSAGPVTGPLSDSIVLLERVHRFGTDSVIAWVADARRDRDADRAIEV